MPRRRAETPLGTTPAQAMSEGGLLADAFRGASWARWRAVLKAAYAEPMDEAELALFREVAERDPPTRQVRELWVIGGRRGGKDSVASAVATVAALRDYSAHLRPGERASVMCLAVDREQARIIHRYITGYFSTVPLLRGLVERETDTGLELKNQVEIIIVTNSFRAVRGRTIACVIFDEVAFWRSEESATPDSETYNAVLPGMVTLPGAMLIGISTPYRRSGLLFDRWRAAYSKPDDDVLVVRGTSRQFNPGLPQRIIDEAMERDPEAAAAEWLAAWRSDLSDFLDRELIGAAVDDGVVVRPPQVGVQYVAFTDASGGRGSSFTCAIAHADGGAVILDALYERRAPFDPADVVDEIAALLRSYEISDVTGDNHGAGWTVEAFARHGIRYRKSERDRSAVYLDALPLFTSGRARLIDHPRTVHQFASLERRASRLGKDRVAQAAGLQDDCANAVAGALVLAATDAAPSLIRASDLGDGEDFNPRAVGGVFAVIALDDFGQAGIVYFAVPRHGSQRPLLIIDMNLLALTPALFADVAGRIDELAEQIRDGAGGHRPVHAGLWVPNEFQPRAYEAMSQVFERHNDRIELRNVLCSKLEDDISPILLADPAKIHFAAAAHATAGKVKFALDGVQRSRELPVMGALTGRLGDRAGDNPLAMAVWLGVVLQFEHGVASPDPFWRGARAAA